MVLEPEMLMEKDSASTLIIVWGILISQSATVKHMCMFKR